MKIVLDVGTGSGILAIWAAQAGAKKVYAVEATEMAKHARSLVAGNGVERIVEVIEGAIEDVDIPEKGKKFHFCLQILRTHVNYCTA
jgi:protein arginine N-methyltransferase 1